MGPILIIYYKVSSLSIDHRIMNHGLHDPCLCSLANHNDVKAIERHPPVVSQQIIIHDCAIVGLDLLDGSRHRFIVVLIIYNNLIISPNISHKEIYLSNSHCFAMTGYIIIHSNSSQTQEYLKYYLSAFV